MSSNYSLSQPAWKADQKAVSHLHKSGIAAALVALLIGIADWIIALVNLPTHDSLIYAASLDRYITAGAIIIAALSLLFAYDKLSRLLSISALLLCALILWSHYPGFNTLVGLLFESRQPTLSNVTLYWAWATTFCLLMSSLSLLLLYHTSTLFWGQWLAFTLFIFTYTTLLAYIIGKATFNEITIYALLPPHFSVAFVCVSVSLFFLHPDKGLARIFSTDLAGSRYAREAFTATVISPIAAGMLIVVLLTTTTLTAAFGIVSFFVLFFTSYLCSAYLNYQRINRFDALQIKLLQEHTALNHTLTQANEEMAILNEELKSALENYNTANEQLQKANQEIQLLMGQRLSQSEQKFKELTESITDLFLAVDTELKYVYWNKACEALTGIPSQQVIGRHIQQVLPYFAGSESMLLQIIAGGQPARYEYHHLHEKKEGYFEVSLFPSPIGLSILVKEITEKKRKEQQILELNKELTDRNFELDQIVYKISHDIRAPLTSVLGLINVLALEPMAAQVCNYIKLIENRILKLDQFTRSMLDFSRTTRSEQVKEQVDIEKTIDECKAELEYMPDFARLQFHLQVSSRAFYTDRLRLKIIFQNLIANAVKYQYVGRKQSYLSIRAEVNAKEAVISFEDNGIGIDEQYMPKLFGMFFRASEQSQGSGLGLYIVKQTVEKLAGSIHLESTLGEGTSIRVRIPNATIERS
jgi:PAS domain S-box-containing protein